VENVEYKVVVYSKLTNLEEYEYFGEEESEESIIEYAKNMADENIITSVWKYSEYVDNYGIHEDSTCIWESEE